LPKGAPALSLEDDVYVESRQPAWIRECVEEALVFFHDYLSFSNTSSATFKIGLPLTLGSTGAYDDIEWLFDLLKLYRVNPKKITFHLHRSEDFSAREVLSAIQALADLGCWVCVDGFFADGPCFEILSNPHIHHISCEGSVTLEALGSHLVWRYLSGLVALSEVLGKSVMLNRVDTEGQLEELSNLGAIWFEGCATGGTLLASEVVSYLDFFQPSWSMAERING